MATGALWWPRVRAGWRATLRAGCRWWSSGGSTRVKRAPPAGRPTHLLAGAVPRNGCDDRYPRRLRVVQWLMDQVVTGARTSGVAGMPGPWSSHKAGTPRGRPSRGTAGTNPKTGGHQPKDWQALPFNTVGDHEFFLDFGDCVFEVVCGSGLGICRYWAPCSRRSILPPFASLFVHSRFSAL